MKGSHKSFERNTVLFVLWITESYEKEKMDLKTNKKIQFLCYLIASCKISYYVCAHVKYVHM